MMYTHTPSVCLSVCLSGLPVSPRRCCTYRCCWRRRAQPSRSAAANSRRFSPAAAACWCSPTRVHTQGLPCRRPQSSSSAASSTEGGFLSLSCVFRTGRGQRTLRVHASSLAFDAAACFGGAVCPGLREEWRETRGYPCASAQGKVERLQNALLCVQNKMQIQKIQSYLRQSGTPLQE